MKKQQWVSIGIPSLIIALSVILFSLMGQSNTSPVKHVISDPTLSVRTELLTPGSVVTQISTHGIVRPRTETQLIAEVKGVVIDISDEFVTGGFFKAGDVLLTLDPSEYQVDVQKAQANLLDSQAKYAVEKARAQQAKNDWHATNQPLSKASQLALRHPYVDEARAKVMYARAELDNAKRLANLTYIRAPYDGMVKSRAVDVGQFVSVGTALGSTFSIDVVEVRLPVKDSDLRLLDPSLDLFHSAKEINGSPVVWLYSVIAGSRHRWPASIVRSEGVINEGNRMHHLVAQVRDPYYRLSTNDERSPPLIIGSFVEAKITGPTLSNVYPVPLSALHNKNHIAVVDAGESLRLTPVKIMYADQELAYAKVSSPIHNNQGVSGPTQIRLITSSIEVPRDGTKVRY